MFAILQNIALSCEVFFMRHCLIYIMGVSGSGKSTIGKKLAEKTGMPFFDADDFHSTANKKKMEAGNPLTDEDRADWLTRMNKLAGEQQEGGAIIACSALKEKYRKILSDRLTIPVYWVFLQGSYKLIQERMQLRADHFMPPALLTSQFDALEVPRESINIDISKKPGEIVETIVDEIEKNREPPKS